MNPLIVLEDDEHLGEYYRLTLEAAGYPVILRANSLNLETLVAEKTPAAVITDMVMPEHEGIEGIFAIVEKHSVPIIAISSHKGYLDLVKDMVAKTLLKPFAGDELVDAVKAVLARAAQTHKAG